MASAPFAPAPDSRQSTAVLRRLAYWLDSGFRVPGTRFRFGLDPLIGLIPGLGDGIGAVLAIGTLLEAARLGVPRATMVRIAWNVAVDALVGAIPVLGDLFDFGWKANSRNIALLDRHLANPAGTRKSDLVFVATLSTALLLILAGVLTGSLWILSLLVP